jgi:DNA (cytosine-5)-methyltransferase 1
VVTGTVETGKRPNIRRVRRIKDMLAQESPSYGQIAWTDTTQVAPPATVLNSADLFSGAGGLTLGLEMAGFHSVFGVESDPVAAATYRFNFPMTALWEGRIENVDLDALAILMGDRRLHLLAGGFPCPGFSVAGQRRLDDKRNQLFSFMVPFVERFQPDFILCENVPGFVTLGGGIFLENIVKAFNAVGYTLSVQILEAAAYGVPQLRPLTIIVGNRLGIPNPFPMPILNEHNFVPIEEAIDDLRDLPRTPEINHEWTRHSREMEERIAAVPPGGSLYPTYVDAWKRQYPGVPSMTVKENHGGTHVHPTLNRVLSARELARLQSFPDSFLFQGTMKRALFQIGNAVPPLLGKHVGLAIRSVLEAHLAHAGEQSAASAVG